MASLARNTFSAGGAIIASEMNSNFTNVENLINDVLDGTESHSNFTSTGTASLATVTATGTVTAGAFSTTGTATAATFVGALTGNVTGNVTGSSGSCTGNAATATTWASDLTVSLGTDLSGSVTFNGDEGTVTLNATVANDSHTHDTRYYTEAESDARFLGITAKAADSDKLDNLDSSQFLRSDTTDTATGRLTIDTSNVGAAGNQSLNILDTSSQGLAGISFRYPNNSNTVQHGVFRMSNSSLHRYVFLQENNSSLADAQLQNLYYSGSLTSTSDETLKNNEGPALGLSFVNRLAPFTGTWIDGDGDKHQFLGAQSVEAALTAEGVNAADYGMIGNDSEIGPRTMSYMELVPVLVQAVNDLTARLEAVEAA